MLWKFQGGYQIPEAKVWPTPAFFRSEIALKLSETHTLNLAKLTSSVSFTCFRCAWTQASSSCQRFVGYSFLDLSNIDLRCRFPPKRTAKSFQFHLFPPDTQWDWRYIYLHEWMIWFSCRWIYHASIHRVFGFQTKPRFRTRKNENWILPIEWIWGWGLIIHDSFLWRLDLQNSLYFSNSTGKVFVAKQNTKWRNGLSWWPAKDKKTVQLLFHKFLCKRLHLDQDLRFDELVWTCRFSSAWDSWLEILVIF